MYVVRATYDRDLWVLDHLDKNENAWAWLGQDGIH